MVTAAVVCRTFVNIVTTVVRLTFIAAVAVKIFRTFNALRCSVAVVFAHIFHSAACVTGRFTLGCRVAEGAAGSVADVVTVARTCKTGLGIGTGRVCITVICSGRTFVNVNTVVGHTVISTVTITVRRTFNTYCGAVGVRFTGLARRTGVTIRFTVRGIVAECTGNSVTAVVGVTRATETRLGVGACRMRVTVVRGNGTFVNINTTVGRRALVSA